MIFFYAGLLYRSAGCQLNSARTVLGKTTPQAHSSSSRNRRNQVIISVDVCFLVAEEASIDDRGRADERVRVDESYWGI